MRTILHAILFLTCSIFLLTAETGCTAAAKKARRLAQANKYFEAGEYEKAEIEYKNVQQLAPLDPDAISHLAIMYFDQGRNGMFAVFLTKAFELQPDNLDVRWRLAAFENGGGKFKEAREQALYVLAKRPDDEEAPMILANTARQPKEIAEIRQILEKLPSAGGAPVLLALAALDLREQKLPEAEARVLKAQALQPKSSLVALGLAAVYAIKNDPVAAEKAYANATALAPARSQAPLRYAEFSMRSGKPDQAKRILTEVTKKTPDFLPAWLLLAQIAESEKKSDETLAAVGKILPLDNIHHEAWLLSARAHLSKGEADEAQTELERLEKSFPKSPELQYELGVVHAAKNEPEKAIVSLNQALAVAPEAVGPIQLLAGLYIRTGSPQLAVGLLTPLVKKQPQLAQARLMLAQAYRVQGNLDAALGVYQQIEKDFRSNAKIGFFEGLIYLQQKKIEEARQAFNKTLAVAPDDVEATEQLVNLEVSEKKFAAAQQRVDAQIAKRPKAPELYLLRAKIFAANADLKQAETALQQVIDLSPDSPVGYYLLAQMHLVARETDKALESLQQSVAKNPKNIQALIQIGVLQEQQKNYKVARETYEKILTINPKASAVLNNLAFIECEEFHELDKALALATEARKEAPASTSIEDTLGWIYYRKQDYARALPLLTESAEKMPASLEGQYHVGMAAYMTGAEEQAKAALEQALNSKTDFAWTPEARQAMAVLTIDPKKNNPSDRAALEKAGLERSDPIALLKLGALSEQSGAIDEAAKSYESVLKVSPGSVRAATGLIRIYLLRHDTAKALELATATRKLVPDNPEVAHILGHLAFVTGDRSRAFALLQESKSKLPDDANVLYDLAEAAYSQGQIATAEDALQGTLAAHPLAGVEAQARELQTMIALAKDPAQALAATARIEQRLKSEPENVPALMALAAAQEKRFDFAAAQKTYEKVLGRYNDFTPAQRNLTIIYSRGTESDPKAVELATKARQAFPGDAELAKAFGILLFRQGNFSRSATMLQESAQTLNTDAEVMFYLGSAQNGLKDKPASTRALQRALELGLNNELADQAKKMLAANGKG